MSGGTGGRNRFEEDRGHTAGYGFGDLIFELAGIVADEYVFSLAKEVSFTRRWGELGFECMGPGHPFNARESCTAR